MADPVKDGGQAFPCLDSGSNGILVLCEPGMSMRDYFAAKVLQGWLASFSPAEDLPAEKMDQLAAFSYTMADAMLHAREVNHG
jgi:hypothetical protein